MKLQLLRNATQILTINNKRILIDPMLAPEGSYDPFRNTGNDTRNPTVDLPVNSEELEIIVSGIDAVLLTHLHLDHWDKTAQDLLPKNIPLFCQPVDLSSILETGFINAVAINQELIWNDIKISRTGGQHGTGEIGKLMGIVSGYVINHSGESVYIAGDTIWCDEVKIAIDQYKPEHIVVNGGGARFVMGDPIVMNIEDILKTCAYASSADIHVVHLESVNHSKETRAMISAVMKAHQLLNRVHVPEDGAVFIS